MADLKDSVGYCPFTGELFLRKKSAPRSNMKVGQILGEVDDQGYIRFQFANKKYRAHRVAYFLMTGSWPELVDHINRQRCDNSWGNLREATQLENKMNSHRCDKLKLLHQ